MKPEKIKGYVAEFSTDDYKKTLRNLGFSLGHMLPKKDLKALAEFRSALAISMPGPERYIRNALSENGYIRGYVEAMQEIAAAFSAEVDLELQFQEDIKFLREAGYVPVVAALLGDQPKSVAQLAKEISQPDISAGKIEECLEWLVGPLVEKLEPENQPVVYRLNLRGEKLVNMLKSEAK